MKVANKIFILAVFVTFLVAQTEPIFFGQQKAIQSLSAQAGFSDAQLNTYIKQRYGKELYELSQAQGAALITDFQNGQISLDDIQPGYDNLETIVETKIIEGTLEELSSYDLIGPPVLYLDNGNHSVQLDTLFFRGEYEETYYLAHYTTTCVASTTKQGFINILPVSSSNTNDSYTFSFESGSTLEDDFIVIDNDLVSDWDFNISANPNWERVENISSDGDASMMMNGKKLTSANPIIFETHSYDLSDLNEPAISFDFIGAAVNSFPTNYLVVSYSKECGIWKELATISFLV